MSSCPRFLLVPVSLLTACALALCAIASGQASHSEQVQVRPPMMRIVDPPSKDATVAELEARADQLRSSKLFLDARDYYRAALVKEQNSARLFNKIGMTEIMMQHYAEARKSLQQAIKADRKFADAYNNLGVVYYETGKYRAAVKEYRKAIAIDGKSASFFNNLGAALFSRKEFEPAIAAYQHALELDPDVLGRSSRAGVQAQLPAPEDRAHYDYTVARLYAKMGLSDQSLEYLRKAMEEGYKDFKNVFKDEEFAQLRKDKRFTELVSMKVQPIPE